MAPRIAVASATAASDRVERGGGGASICILWQFRSKPCYLSSESASELSKVSSITL